ncbi:MAG: choice-of-anchor D domain-containing protein [Synergistetes bacterium]|nr:choice-of-anchor D domain-containing protein [Synergistota bacterium]MDW8191600.1 choice-of-anchor D domain-containing protein [Synergistota bacterium]
MRNFRAVAPALIVVGLIGVLSFVLPAFASLGWKNAFIWGGSNHDLSNWYPNRALVPLSGDRFYVVYEDAFFNNGANTFQRIWGIEGRVVQSGAEYYVEWKAPEEIDVVEQVSYKLGCVSAVVSGEEIHIAYYKQVSTTSYKLIYAKRSSSGVWSKEIVGNSTGTLNKNRTPSIAISGNTVYIAYYDDSNKLVSVSKSSGSWSTPSIISSAASSRPSLGIRAGSPVVAYISSNGVQYAYGAPSWVSTTATTSPSTGKFIALGFDASGYPHVAFASESGVFVAYSTTPNTGPWFVRNLKAPSGDAEWVDIYSATVGNSVRMFAFYATGATVAVSYFPPLPSDAASVSTATLIPSTLATEAVVFAFHNSSASTLNGLMVHILGTDNSNLHYWHAFNIASGTTRSPDSFPIIREVDFGKNVAGIMSGGVFHAVAFATNSYEIWYLRRSDDGYWMAEMVTQATASALGITLSGGTPHIAYIATSSVSKLYYSYRIGFESWSGPTDIAEVSTPATSSRGVAIAVDSSDGNRPYIAYIDKDKIYLFRKSNTGGWIDVLSGSTAPTVPLASASSSIDSISMKIVNGDLYLSYGKDSQEVHWIWRDNLKNMDNQDTQRTDTIVEYSTVPYSPVHTDIFVDPARDRAYIVYRAGLEDLKEARYVSSTLTFEGRKFVDSQGVFEWPSSIVVNNSLVVSYYQYSQATAGDVKGLKVAYEGSPYTRDEVDGCDSAAYDVGQYSQIGTDGNKLYVLSYDATNKALKIAVSDSVPYIAPPSPPGTLDVSPKSYDFGNVLVGSSASANFTLTNTTSSNISVSISSSDNAFVPAVSATTVPANGSVSFAVKFSPTQDKGYSGTVTITGGGYTLYVAVSGKGYVQPPPGQVTLTVDTSDMNFGEVFVNESKLLRRNVIVSNGTNNDVNVNIAIAGAGASAFTISNTTWTAPANKIYEKEVIITFEPTDGKDYEATVTVSAGNQSKSFKVKGKGVFKVGEGGGCSASVSGSIGLALLLIGPALLLLRRK